MRGWFSHLVLGISALALGLPSSAVAQGLQPRGKWVVDFDDTQCVATRNYGSEQKPLYLAIKAPPLARVFQVAIAQPGGYRAPVQHNVSITIGNAAPYATTLLAFSRAGRRVHVINIPAARFASARGAQAMRIRASNGLDQTFRLDATEALLSTLQTCVTDLEAYWGGIVDTPVGLVPGRIAEGTLVGLFNSGDYPAVAVDQRQEGTINAILMVDERGKIADCTVVETSGSASLDAQACAIFKERAKLKPARDGSGKPVRGLLQQRVTWRMQ